MRCRFHKRDRRCCALAPCGRGQLRCRSELIRVRGLSRRTRVHV
ncbi:hypothetical protein BF49_1265 [Bradyrhizobium sp.]|nr:hypothetical protein BF49_1265 [Bradyrhizobium sp.]